MACDIGLTRPYADGHVTMRCVTGYLQADDGLLAEMAARQEPVPWESAEVRDEALRSIRNRRDLEDDVRADLLEWVAASPYYED